MHFRVRFYPHNDLFNLASYHLSIAERKALLAEENGVTLDCLSCIMALGFSVEAIVNFVGSKRVPAWNERASFPEKLKGIDVTLRLNLDLSADPMATVKIVRDIRNMVAHGKPMEFVSPAASRAELRKAMAAPWDPHATLAFSQKAIHEVRVFRDLLFSAAKVKIGSSLTSASNIGE